MINFIKQKNDMKKLAYIVITSSMFLTTSCVDLTQEPQSFITEEEYIARMDLTSLQQATTGLYNDLWNGNYGFNCRLQRINVCADDITYRAAKANNELANYYRLTPNHHSQQCRLQDYMGIILYCNQQRQQTHQQSGAS